MAGWTIIAGLYGLMGVGFAAWGAHGLDGQASAWVERASLFQLIHAAALLALARPAVERRGLHRLGGWGLAVGTALFSGSLYLRAMGLPLPVPMITPSGGIILMLGWGAVLAAGVNDARRGRI